MCLYVQMLYMNQTIVVSKNVSLASSYPVHGAHLSELTYGRGELRGMSSFIGVQFIWKPFWSTLIYNNMSRGVTAAGECVAKIEFR